MPTSNKIETVASLKERFSAAQNIFVTDYSGLNVEQMTKLRRNLRNSGITYLVAKNTLMRLAARETGYDEMVKYLSGPTAVALSTTDPNIPAKILFDAGKEFENVSKPAIRAFFIDRQLFDGGAAEEIAKLPSRPVLLSILVSAVEGPISNLIGTIDGIIRELVGTLDAMARKKEEK